MRHRLPIRHALLLLAGAAALAACGSDGAPSGAASEATTTSSVVIPPSTGKDEYSRADLAAQIEAAQQKAAPDLGVTGAVCPLKIEAKVGATFTCTVEVGGTTAPYAVDITSIDGGDARFHFAPAKAIIQVSKATMFLVDAATKQGFDGATADCGTAPVVVIEAGGTFPCTVTTGNGPQDVTILVKDTDGNITVQT